MHQVKALGRVTVRKPGLREDSPDAGSSLSNADAAGTVGGAGADRDQPRADAGVVGDGERGAAGQSRAGRSSTARKPVSGCQNRRCWRWRCSATWRRPDRSSRPAAGIGGPTARRDGCAGCWPAPPFRSRGRCPHAFVEKPPPPTTCAPVPPVGRLAPRSSHLIRSRIDLTGSGN
jgi:hypothetical protein